MCSHQYCFFLVVLLMLSWSAAHRSKDSASPPGTAFIQTSQSTRSAATTPGFESFIQSYGRTYKPGTSKFEERRSIYETRAAEVQRLNKRPQRLWTAGINSLSDWTDEELKTLRGWSGSASPTKSNSIGTAGQGSNLAANQVDLRQAYRVTPLPQEHSWESLQTSSNIRNQGSCGSCWAVSAATVLDANAEIHLGRGSRQFSSKDLVACTPNKQHCGGDGGCQGATVELAYNYAMRSGVAVDGSKSQCNSDPAEVVLASGVNYNFDPPLSDEELTSPGAHLAQSPHMPGVKAGLLGWERLPENKYEPLMRALVQRGPVAVSVAAGGSWHYYSGGIFDHCNKDAVIDHAVTLIGYGKDSELNTKFWHIQNSWGGGWGEKGLIRLLRHHNEDDWCGTDHKPDVGTGCNGGPATVKVCGMCGILYDTVVPIFNNSSMTSEFF